MLACQTAATANQCPTNIGGAPAPATLSRSGRNFSCVDWSMEDGPGKLVLVELCEEPFALAGLGDVALVETLSDVP